MNKPDFPKEFNFYSGVPIIRIPFFVFLLILIGNIVINNIPISEYFLAVLFWGALFLVFYKIRPRLIINSNYIIIKSFFSRHIINIDQSLVISIKNAHKRSLSFSYYPNYFYYVPNLIFTNFNTKQVVGKLDLGIFIWSPKDLKTLPETIEKLKLPIVVDHSINKWLEHGHNSIFPIVNKDKYPLIDSTEFNCQVKAERFYRATNLKSLLKQRIVPMVISQITILILGLIVTAIIWLYNGK